jgi:hypothetical protein
MMQYETTMEMRMKCEQMQVNTFQAQVQKAQHLPGSSSSIIATLFLIFDPAARSLFAPHHTSLFNSNRRCWRRTAAVVGPWQ